VPGVLSSNKGRDFGAFLGALVELGYGWSYRVLDAQYFGVAQRRRRVFVVGHLGDWKPSAKVLFESESLRRNIKQGGQEGEKIAKCLTTRIRNDFETEQFVTYVAEKAPTLLSSAAGLSRPGSDTTADSQYIAYALQGAGSTSQNNNGSGFKEEQSFTLNRTDVHGVAYAFEPGMAKRDGNPNRFVEEMSPTLRANMGDNQVATAHAFKIRGGSGNGGKGYLGADETAFTLSTLQDQHIYHQMAVRRLTEVECERLQGFPDNYTNIKENCPSGPRYKALGNSMAVPVMRWIGERINKYESGNL